MVTDNNRFYIVAKKFDEAGCIAYKCKNLSEARNVPNTLEAIRAKDVQIVILDDPEIYSEYAPYKYIDDLREFMNQAGNLNLIVQNKENFLKSMSEAFVNMDQDKAGFKVYDTQQEESPLGFFRLQLY